MQRHPQGEHHPSHEKKHNAIQHMNIIEAFELDVRKYKMNETSEWMGCIISTIPMDPHTF